jgi:hypothetical protein
LLTDSLYLDARWCRCASLCFGLLCLLGSGLAKGAPFTEEKNCRPLEENGEFLQDCVKVHVGRKPDRILGPGRISSSGDFAAVLQHRRYGSKNDRVTLKIYDAAGKLWSTVLMSERGDEYTFHWAPRGCPFLAWVEVDGRGGTLRVLDVRRRRFSLSLLTPLDDWPFFPSEGCNIMIPRGEIMQETLSPRVTELEIMNLETKKRKVVLRASSEEAFVDVQWSSSKTITATLRSLAGKKDTPVKGGP